MLMNSEVDSVKDSTVKKVQGWNCSGLLVFYDTVTVRMKGKSKCNCMTVWDNGM